jgi:hypothetical protein
MRDESEKWQQLAELFSQPRAFDSVHLHLLLCET